MLIIDENVYNNIVAIALSGKVVGCLNSTTALLSCVILLETLLYSQWSSLISVDLHRIGGGLSLLPVIFIDLNWSASYWWRPIFTPCDLHWSQLICVVLVEAFLYSLWSSLISVDLCRIAGDLALLSCSDLHWSQFICVVLVEAFLYSLWSSLISVDLCRIAG